MGNQGSREWSGAKPTYFTEVNESFKAYGVVGHRHTPEMEQELSKVCGSDLGLLYPTCAMTGDLGNLLWQLEVRDQPGGDLPTISSGIWENPL